MLTRFSAVALVFTLGACSPTEAENDHVGPPAPSEPGAPVKLEATDCNALRTSIVESVADAIVHARYGGIEIDDKLGGKGDEAEGTEDEQHEIESEPPPIEAEDLVKVVGEQVFVLSDDRVELLALAEDGAIEQQGAFVVGEGLTAIGLFADANAAVLLHGVSEDADGPFAGTRVTVLDLADTANPVLRRQFDVEGDFEMARRQGDDFQLVTSTRWRIDRSVWELAYGDAPSLPDREPDADEERQIQLRGAARADVEQRLASELGDMATLMPRLALEHEPEPLYACDAVFTVRRRPSVRVTSMTRFTVDGAPSSFGVVGNSFAGAVHADRFWAAFSAGWGVREGTSDLQAFDLDGGYHGAMEIEGTLVDEFSVSATHDAVHLITVSRGGASLQTVAFDDDALQEPTPAVMTDAELIVANRITSHAAYVATGGDADQIFAMGLDDAKATGPFELGGVPSMIHTLDDDRILVVAQQNDEGGQQVGVRVRVFGADAEPLSSAEIATGEFAAWSEAMWEPKSLAYADGLVAFPVNIEAWEEADGANFSGVLLYDAGGEIARRGAIDHTDLRAARWCLQNDQPEDCDAPQSNPWWTHVRRSTFVGTRIVTVSDAGVKVHDLETLTELGSHVFD